MDLVTFIPYKSDSKTGEDYCHEFSDYSFFSNGIANPNLVGASAILIKGSPDEEGAKYYVAYNYLSPYNIFATYNGSDVIYDYSSLLGDNNRAHEIFNGGEVIVSGGHIYKTYSSNDDFNVEFFEDMSIDNGIDTIGGEMFKYCDLTTIRLPWVNDLTIGAEAFYGCSSLEYFFCYNRVSSVGDSAFKGCSSLIGNEIACGDYVTRRLGDSNLKECLKVCFDCGEESFRGCTSLTKIAFHDSTYEDTGTTSEYSIVKIAKTNHNSGYIIGDYAFADCTSLSSITSYYCNNSNYSSNTATPLFISFKDINVNSNNGKYCFANCSSLDGTLIFQFKDTIEDTIPEGMFSGCTGITHLSLSYNYAEKLASASQIGCRAFADTGISRESERAELEKIATNVEENDINRIFGHSEC